MSRRPLMRENASSSCVELRVRRSGQERGRETISMSVDAFLDTNVLIYAVSSSPEDSAKKERALQLIEIADFGLSAQVLQEFYVNVTRKIASPLAPDAAVELLDQFRHFPMVPTDYPLIVAGAETAVRFVLGRRNCRGGRVSRGANAIHRRSEPRPALWLGPGGRSVSGRGTGRCARGDGGRVPSKVISDENSG